MVSRSLRPQSETPEKGGIPWTWLWRREVGTAAAVLRAAGVEMTKWLRRCAKCEPLLQVLLDCSVCRRPAPSRAERRAAAHRVPRVMSSPARGSALPASPAARATSILWRRCGARGRIRGGSSSGGEHRLHTHGGGSSGDPAAEVVAAVTALSCPDGRAPHKIYAAYAYALCS